MGDARGGSFSKLFLFHLFIYLFFSFIFFVFFSKDFFFLPSRVLSKEHKGKRIKRACRSEMLKKIEVVGLFGRCETPLLWKCGCDCSRAHATLWQSIL